MIVFYLHQFNYFISRRVSSRMPKITFFNLPENKRQTLINEARREFSRAPLYEASIANIIKGAGIPRGSFYQYFDDKEDIYFFILGEYAKEKRIQFLQILKSYNGDLERTFLHFYNDLIKEEENYSFLRNALLNMTYETKKIFERMICSKEINEKSIEFISSIDQTKLNVTNSKELFHAIRLLMGITIHNLIHAYALKLSYEEATEIYRLEMNLLKQGLFNS